MIGGRRVPTLKELNSRVVYGTYSNNDYLEGIERWAKRSCERASAADRDFCSAADAMGLLEPNPVGKAILEVAFQFVCNRFAPCAVASMAVGLLIAMNDGPEAQVNAAMDTKGPRSPGGKKSSGSCALPNSFTGETLVLMADGSTKRIDEIRVGDRVANSDPESEHTEQNEVVFVHVTDADKDYVDLEITGLAGSQKVTTTAHHPFYLVEARAWGDAADLKVGDWLNTPGNGRAVVSAARLFQAELRTYNLSIDNVHSFYVLAGSTPVLVHNSPPPPPPPGIIYLRTDILTGAEYVGQAIDEDNYKVRQYRHRKDYPGAIFEFEILDRGYPGADLNVREESWMRAGGGKRTIPGSVLQNKRVQMNDMRYKAAGGDVSCP